MSRKHQNGLHGARFNDLAKPLTTTTIIFVGSGYKAVYRNFRQPTKKMVLVVNGVSRHVAEPWPLKRFEATHAMDVAGK